jgi:hypothetical protein
MSELSDRLDNFVAASRSFAPGELLFARGDTIEWLYIVREGQVHLARYDENGNPAVMQRARSGAILAESSVFAEVYHCDGEAVEPSLVAMAPMPVVQTRVNEDAALMSLFARHLAEVARQCAPPFGCEVKAPPALDRHEPGGLPPPPQPRSPRAATPPCPCPSSSPERATCRAACDNAPLGWAPRGRVSLRRERRRSRRGSLAGSRFRAVARPIGGFCFRVEWCAVRRAGGRGRGRFAAPSSPGG